MGNHARILTSVRFHAKFIRSGPAASWLWVCGVLYCQDALTDGFIAADVLHLLGVPKPLPLAAVLVREGLWHEEPNGWRIHDYLDHNNSAEYINRIRKERKAAGQKGGRAKHPLIKAVNQLDKQIARDVLEQLPQQTGNPTFFGTTTTINGTEEKQERADAAPNPVENFERVDRLNAALRHRRLRSRETATGKPATHVIAALARDVIAQHPCEHDDGELREMLKKACARINLHYDSTAVATALDRARAQLQRRATG